MLDLAINHEKNLKKKMRSIMFNEKFKFENICSYYEDFELKKLIGWEQIQCVSYDKRNDEVRGYMSATIDRDGGYINGLRIINFSNDKVVFGIDLKQFLLMLAKREDLIKINFSVVIGNPIEKSYDEMVKKYGGKIVGVYEKDSKLSDGKIYDRKVYEIFTEKIREKLRMKMWRQVEI